MRSAIFSRTRKRKLGCRGDLQELERHIRWRRTSSTGAPPSATTTPLFRGSVDERSSGPPPRNGMIWSCGSTLRLPGVSAHAQNNCWPSTTANGPKRPCPSRRPIALATAVAILRPWFGGGGGAARLRAEAEECLVQGAPVSPLRQGFPKSAGAQRPPANGGVTIGGGGKKFITSPLNTTASSRRARTFAARRNRSSTLLISESAICAPRTVHLDLQGREPHCALIVDGYPPPLLTEVGGRQWWGRQSPRRTKSASAGRGP